MFRNIETGKFSPKMVVDTTKIVLKDMLPLSALYAKMKSGSLLFDTTPHNNQQAFYRWYRGMTDDWWYAMMTPNEIKNMKIMTIACEFLGGIVASTEFLKGDYLSAATMLMMAIAGKTIFVGHVRDMRGDLKHPNIE